MIDLPQAEQLGPDPEAPRLRAELLLERVAAERYRTGKAAIACPLAHAMGRRAACIEGRCPYFRVPGTHMPCAVDQWSPATRRDPRIAHWFIARREEIARGRVA
jgi:hypothetical protein